MNKVEKIHDRLYSIDTDFKYVDGIFTKSYLLLGDKSIGLIDAGTIGTEQQVFDLLETLGIENSKLNYILLSHAHADHVGGLNGLFARTNPVLFVQKKGTPLINDISLMFWDFMKAFPLQFPISKQVEDNWYAIVGNSISANIINPGDDFSIDLGGILLKAIPSAGHSVDSVSYYEPHFKWLFTGDSICGNGPFNEPPCYRDVNEYRSTLTRVRNLDVELLLSGHFSPMNAVSARNLVLASEEMVNKIEDIVIKLFRKTNNPLFLEDVGKEISNQISKRYLVQSLFTAKAHLDYLERKGEITKYGNEGAAYLLA